MAWKSVALSSELDTTLSQMSVLTEPCGLGNYLGSSVHLVILSSAVGHG